MAVGMKTFRFQRAPKNSHIEGIHPQSESFHKRLYCQQFSGEPHPTFSSIKATVGSTVTDHVRPPQEKMSAFLNLSLV